LDAIARLDQGGESCPALSPDSSLLLQSNAINLTESRNQADRTLLTAILTLMAYRNLNPFGGKDSGGCTLPSCLASSLYHQSLRLPNTVQVHSRLSQRAAKQRFTREVDVTAERHSRI
jgi:hypothetical protein